ncbi:MULTISPECIES: GntR family transcriptional regulator [Rhodococcus]|uniref:Putative GntR family transcriptional regulator n=1 Tax=Rhodococcus opacus (strain B4) TaxID=632772 RepID=C1BD76_RHOOB|nr:MULTISPECIES: GntR family transcriptional regulator [Rhodococcus]UOT08071.1 GntR family transcriptional regulator [Rhodococcus opacus]BAH55820.1 putative GntR family transcriptional regulator [Rhodococcus opacus B4]
MEISGGARVGSATGASATENAYRHIKRLILTSELAPGTELREATLSESTGFGRSPVRESLRRLVQEGFVDVRARQGYRVSVVTMASVRDLFEMRLLLEPAVVELAAERAPMAELEALHSLAHQTYVSGDIHSYEKFLEDNREFHVRIAQASGNEIFTRTLRTLLEEMQRLFFISLDGSDSVSEQMHEHHDLHDALLARDGTRAREIMIAQIEASRERVMEGLVGAAQRPRRAATGVVLSSSSSSKRGY